MEESETLISERDIPRLLSEYQCYAVNCIMSNQLQQGFEILLRSQELIQAAISQDAIVPLELIILTEHTLALYYHNVDDPSNKAISLSKTISLFKKYLKSLPKSVLSKPSYRILKARVLCKLHLQLFGTYSKLENFDLALSQCQSALKKSQSIIHFLLKTCQDHLYRHKIMSTSCMVNQQYSLFESPHYKMFHQSVLKMLPVFLYLDEKKQTSPKISAPDIAEFELANFLEVVPMDIENLVKGPEIMEELEKDLMMEKVILHIATHYFLANHMKKEQSEENSIESKILMKRAWNMCRNFVPSDCAVYARVSAAWDNFKTIQVNRVRSISRIKPQTKGVHSEIRSASSNKFRPSPSRKLNDTFKENLNRQDQNSLLNKRKTVRRFKKVKSKIIN